LEAVDDDPVSGIEAFLDDPHVVDCRAQFHLAVGDRVVGIDDKHELLVLVGADRPLADEEMLFSLWLTHSDPHELPGNELAVGIAENRPYTDRACRSADLVVDQLQLSTDGSI